MPPSLRGPVSSHTKTLASRILIFLELFAFWLFTFQNFHFGPSCLFHFHIDPLYFKIFILPLHV